MTTHKSGDTVYAPNGATLIFDHRHGNAAYCYPVIVIQTTNYREDAFEEHETEAEHLIAIPWDELSTKPPVTVLHENIEALLDKKEAIKSTIRELTTGAVQAKTFLRDMEARKEKYQHDNPVFDEIANLIDGTPMYPLIIRRHTNNGMEFNSVTQADWKKFDLITLSKTNQGKFEWTSNPKSRAYSAHDKLEFFPTEDAMQKYVKEQFVVLLEAFYKLPDPTATHSYNNPYRNILAQVVEFSFLEIPEKVTALVKTYEVEQHNKQLEAAEKRLMQLKGTTNVT